MSKFLPPDNDDLEFFKKAMKDVRRSNSFVRRPSSKNRLNSTKSRTTEKEENHEKENKVIRLSDPLEQTIGAQDRLFFSRSGLQHKRSKQLIYGEIPQSNYLDLHQMTVEQARLAVMNFLIHSREHDYRCVRIIHGKGQLSKSGANLKNHVNFWLQQISWVLAFCSAQAKDGGTGAVYVLLRRIR